MRLYIFRQIGKTGKQSTLSLLRKCSLQYIKDTSHSSCSSFCGEVLYTDKGKPYFSKDEIMFSISHSDDIWVCVMAEENVGVDVEKVREIDAEKIADRFFSEAEKKYINFQETDKSKRFFEIWTAKEAYGKLLGIGISSGMLGLDTVMAAKEGKIAFKKIYAIDGFMCTVCFEKQTDSKQIDSNQIKVLEIENNK